MEAGLNKLIISGITGSQNEARITLVGVDGTNSSALNYLKNRRRKYQCPCLFTNISRWWQNGYINYYQ